MPDIEIYNNDKEALFQGVRLIIFSGLSLVLNKEKDCDFKRHLSWVGYTPLVEVNQAILAWSFQTKNHTPDIEFQGKFNLGAFPEIMLTITKLACI